MSSESSALYLAQVLGIADYELSAQGSTASDEDLDKAYHYVGSMTVEAKAVFCAFHLPSLVTALVETYDEEDGPSAFSLSCFSILDALIDQPLLKGHFLRCYPGAKALVIVLVTVFVACSEAFFVDNDDDVDQEMTTLSLYTSVVEEIILACLYHGPTSPVDLNLPSSLGSALLSACQKLRLLATQSSTTPQEVIQQCQDQLDMFPTMLCVEGAKREPESLEAIRREVASTGGFLRCEIRKKALELGRGEKCTPGLPLMFCGICKSVAYCSPEHQRADWKKHKPFCFKPRW